MIKKLMSLLFSGEFFFAMFLFVGYFKEVIGIQIDLAAVFLGLTFIVLIKRLLLDPTINKNYLLPIGLLCLFFIYFILGYYYSSSLINSQEKILKFITLTIPASVTPFLLFKTNRNIKRFTLSILLISLGSVVYVLPSTLDAFTGFVGYGELGNYQGLARLTGAGLILLIFYAFVSAKTKTMKLIFVILILAFSFVLLSTGSRMPLVALVVVTIYYFFTSFKISNGILYIKKEMKYIIGAIILSMPALIFFGSKGFFDTIIFRFEVLFRQSGGGTSIQGRTERFSESLSYLGNKPIFGNGTGSFGYMYTGRDINDYPHNLFLEILSENGLIGLIIFTIILGYAFYLFKNSIKNNLTFIWLLMSLFFGFNSMVSGDINSNRMLFTAISTLITVSLLNRNRSHINIKLKSGNKLLREVKT